jgi:RNAse (barnase) inhibitor barstar
MRKPSMKQAEWIAKRISESADDVYDVLLGNITLPVDFVFEVMQYSMKYNKELDAKLKD